MTSLHRALLLGGLAAATAALAEPRNVHALPTSWRTEDGAGFTLTAMRGRPFVLAFLYTSCPGTCPLTTKKVKTLDGRLRAQGTPLDVVVVSLDPAHDTPEVVAGWRRRFGLEAAPWRVLTGDEGTLRSLTMLLGFKYRRNAESGAIVHDNDVFLVGPTGEVVAQVSALDDEAGPILEGARKLGP